MMGNRSTILARVVILHGMVDFLYTRDADDDFFRVVRSLRHLSKHSPVDSTVA